MSKNKLNQIILDSADAVSFNGETSREYLVENKIDFDSFAKRGLKELGTINGSGKQLTKSQNFFRRLVLAARITDECFSERTFGSVKFQKMVYICEHASRMNFSTNYQKQAAGPFDNKFMHAIKKGFEKQKWFTVEKVTDGKYTKVQFTPLDNVAAYRQYYNRYFGEVNSEIEHLISIFKKWKTDDVELVATIFACWDEIKNEKSILSEDLLIQKVYAWHEKKKKFSKEQILNSLKWMKERGVYPV